MYRKIQITFFVLINFVYAQNSSDDVTQQIWFDYYPQWDLTENFTVYGSAGARTIIPNSWNKLFITAAVRYSPKPLFNVFNRSQEVLHGGLSVFYTFNEDKPNQIELRPYEGYEISWPNIDNLRFTHFIRLEERFIFTIGDSDFDFELRGRYKIEAIFHRTKHLVDFANGIYLPVSVEFFINLYSTEEFNDAIRVTPGIGYSSESKLWKIQFDLSYQYADKAESGNFTKNTIIYRLRFYQAI
jgi:hypothetical protein